MHSSDNETIVAIATPIGEGALAVIRVSGSHSLRLVDCVFRGRRPLVEAEGYTVHYGRIVNAGGELVDQVLATVFRSPHSYSGEDSVEISCHGGTIVSSRILDALIGSGAKQAEPGEFTKRAFLNGKMDLCQAEAVAELISSRSVRAYKASLDQLQGRLGKKVNMLRSKLLDLCSLLELELDFSEEGIDLVPKPDVIARLGEIAKTISAMLESYESGRLYRDGIRVVLMGLPNVGKSSLFNALLKEERAIVTQIPGTTRDVIEESVQISGVLFRISDTAGLRETADQVESEGILRARSNAAHADIALIVEDCTEARPRDKVLQFLCNEGPPPAAVIARNKADLLATFDHPPQSFEHGGVRGVEVYVSAKTGLGMNSLRETLSRLVFEEPAGNESSSLVTSKRHAEALGRAASGINAALNLANTGATNEIIAVELRDATAALSEVTGEVTTEDILNNIFGRFCVGK